MIEEIIESIVAAEDKAEDVVKNSRVQAKEIVLQAQDEARAIAEAAAASLKETKAQALTDAEYVAERAGKIACEDDAKRAETLRAKAQEKKAACIDAIISHLYEE